MSEVIEIPSETYWATCAQTMPVLGLAIVVEARTITSRWKSAGRIYRSMQGLLWAGPLIIYALAIPSCFEALLGRHVWAGVPMLIDVGIRFGLATLVFTPAIELIIRSNARAFAVIALFARPIFWGKYLRLKRENGRIRSLVETRLEVLAELDLDYTSVEDELRVQGHEVPCDECRPIHEKIWEGRDKIDRIRTYFERLKDRSAKLRGRISKLGTIDGAKVDKLESDLEKVGELVATSPENPIASDLPSVTKSSTEDS